MIFSSNIHGHYIELETACQTNETLEEKATIHSYFAYKNDGCTAAFIRVKNKDPDCWSAEGIYKKKKSK